MKAEPKLYKSLEQNLTEKKFLKQIKISKKAMLGLLAEYGWKQKAAQIEQIEEAEGNETGSCRCAMLLDQAEETMARLSPVPEEGWLPYIYQDINAELFPEQYEKDQSQSAFSAGKLFYLEALRTLLAYRQKKDGFSPLLNLELLRRGENPSFFWR